MRIHLSERERQIVISASRGITDKETCRRLGISQRTIGTYWERIRHKTGAASRTEIVVIVMRQDAEDAACAVLEAKRNADEFQLADRFAQDIDPLEPEQQLQVMALLALRYGFTITVADSKSVIAVVPSQQIFEG